MRFMYNTTRSAFVLLLVLLLTGYGLLAQGYLLNEDKLKSFVLSERFEQHGVVETDGLPFPNRAAFVDEWPSMEEWSWQFAYDSVAVTMTIADQNHRIAFKNNIQAYTGLDKSELGAALMERLKNVNASEQQSTLATKRSEPNDTLYGFLYHISFFTNDTPDYGMGNALQCLWRELSEDTTAVAFTTVIPQYGYKRDTLLVDAAELNAVLDGERWDFWMGMQDDAMLLYAKNVFFDYAHMFYIAHTVSAQPLLEWHAYIPTANVRDLFVTFREKKHGLGIEVQGANND